MQFIDGHTILIFLGQLFLLLFFARIFGEIFRYFKLPAVAGEILAGLLLGSIIFGNLFPELHRSIFPEEESLFYMLETISWLGVFFLLFLAGLEVDISTVMTQGKPTIYASLLTLGIPFVLGMAFGFLIPSSLIPNGTERWLFAFFLGIVSGIAAVPVIAKILHDMDMLKSDVGLLALSVATIGDLIGWTMFTVALGLIVGNSIQLFPAIRILVLTLVLIAFSLTLGKKWVDKLIIWLKHSDLPTTESMLSLVFLLSIFYGILAEWIGIHGLFGFFIAGIMLGDAKDLDESAREMIKQVIFSFFAPIFFANIGLKIQISGGLNFYFIFIILVIAMGGKFLGGFLGSRLGGFSKGDALHTGIAVSPGGAMEIVLALLAFEYNIINLEIFVAIVIMAVTSSVLAGPLLSFSMRKGKKLILAHYFNKELFFPSLPAASKKEAVEKMVDRVLEHYPNLDKNTVLERIFAREDQMSTGLERGLALPHARLENIREPIICYAKCDYGIEWNSMDGKPATNVFLIFTPKDDPGFQTYIISKIAQIWHKRSTIESLLKEDSFDKFVKIFEEALNLAQKQFKIKHS